MMRTATSGTPLVTAIGLLSGAIFLMDVLIPADVLIPGDVIPPMLYIVLLVLTLRLPSQASTVLAGITGTALTIAGSWWDPPVGTWWPAFSHRLLALFALWLTVALCVLYKRTGLVLRAKERVLEESSQRFRQLADHITEVFWLTDPEKTHMLYISPGYEAIWGRSCESLYASPRSWLEAIHPEDRDRVFQTALTKQVGGTYSEEYRIVRPDGTIRWIWDRAFPVLNDVGVVYRIAGIAQDITDRKQAEEALQASERHLRELFEARERLARDLHDHLIQSLYAIGLELRACRRMIGAKGDSVLSKLDDALASVNGVIRGVRGYITGLEVQLPAPQEFSTALAALVRTMNEAGPLRWDAKIDPTVGILLRPADGVQLLHIVREAMSNSVRHSGGQYGAVSLVRQDGHVRLTVEDDGAGFEHHADRPAGRGLPNMQARASLLGAEFEIQSRSGGGTHVVVTIPTHRA